MEHGRKKIIVITTVVLICLSIFCSFLFITELADHHCTHDDGCAVCRVIALCLNNIRGVMTAAASVLIALAAVLTAAVVLPCLRTAVYADTLISLKVELLN